MRSVRGNLTSICTYYGQWGWCFKSDPPLAASWTKVRSSPKFRVAKNRGMIIYAQSGATACSHEQSSLQRGLKVLYLLISTHFLFVILTCAHRMRVHFCPQHWLLCHVVLYKSVLENAITQHAPFIENKQQGDMRSCLLLRMNSIIEVNLRK